MKTLIELYDDRPIENVLATEVFRPDRTVWLCPAEVAQDRNIREKLKEYFARFGLAPELVFLESSLFNREKILRQLRSVTEKYGECILDITGGSEAALFACGQFCQERNVPAFTYSRRRNCFYNIFGADFADELPCTVTHRVEDCFLMAGGSMRSGRFGDGGLDRYMDMIGPFFDIYVRYRSRWTKIVQYFQRTSQVEKGMPIPLKVKADLTVYGDRGVRIDAPADCMRDLETLGFLSGVKISGDRVSYAFLDRNVRSWLRDIGSVLELYVYKACLDTGLFNDVCVSAVVDWEGGFRQDDVTNEIDVMAVLGILPAFISCKTCEVDTYALNELAVLRDRFGGNGAKAAIVTTRSCRTITRRRAAELGIDVIDMNDLKGGAAKQIANVMRPE